MSLDNQPESYEELMSQAQALLAQAEQIRKSQKASVIAEIKEKMKTFGITAEELGDTGGTRKKVAGSKAKSEPKYRGPNGEPWSGGPGRRPGAAGRKGAGHNPRPAPNSRAPRGRPGRGGRGRRPGWVKAVVAAGEDLENYRIQS